MLTLTCGFSNLIMSFRLPFDSFHKQYTLAQPHNYYGSAATTYGQKLAYAQPATGAATSYLSSLQASHLLNAQASNSAIQYATPQQLYQPSLAAAKYSYAQIPTAQKFFYASS